MAGRSLDDYAQPTGEGLDPVLAEFLESGERASADNRATFDQTGLRAGGVGRPGPPDTATKILDRVWTAPLAVGGLAGLVRPEDEPGVVWAAGAAGLPVVVDTFTPYALASLVPAGDGPRWLRAYAFQDRGDVERLAADAESAGFAALVLALGPQCGTEPRRTAGAVDAWPDRRGPGLRPNPLADWADVERLRAVSSLPLLVAGIRTAVDASRALDSGADGLVTDSLDALPALTLTAAAGGRRPVLLGGGIRRGADVLVSLASGADAVLVAVYQYGPTAGQIREIVADSLRADEGIDVPAESIVITVGAQEAMFLVLRALAAGPDDVLLVASPCYVGITGAARLLGVPVTAVEEREDGFSCVDLEAAIVRERTRGRRPRAVYVIPDHSNPSGITMDAPTRTALLDVADRHGILVIEDSPYRRVSPGTPLPTLKSLDRARRVVHLGSFAKTVFPGARVGFAVADQLVVDESGRTGLLAGELAKIKSMVTVNTSSLSQAVVAGALLTADGRISEMNAEPAAYDGNAMRTTLRNLDARLPAARRAALGVRWNEPTGGFFLTVHVPFRADNAALTRSAQDFGVIWTPMNYFYPQGGGHQALRLSTSYLTTADIEEGTARLARFIEAQLAAP